jgi:hypothetical protein
MKRVEVIINTNPYCKDKGYESYKDYGSYGVSYPERKHNLQLFRQRYPMKDFLNSADGACPTTKEFVPYNTEH